MPTQTPSSLRDLRRQRLAEKWVRETEDFLNANREGPSKGWPLKPDPHVCDEHRSLTGKESVHGSEMTIDVRPAPNGTWLVSLEGDQYGHLDTDRAQDVVDQLDDLMAVQRPGRVIMDLGSN